MHVLITGGAGFIGSHLAELHLARNDKIHVVDDLSTGSLANIAAFRRKPNFRFSKANLLTWSGLDKAVAWADRIYHMAAVVGVMRVLSDPVKVMRSNVEATERLLHAVHEGGWHPQVVVASSAEVYGFNSEPAFHEGCDIVLRSGGRLRWTYAVTKLVDEYLSFSYTRVYSLDITVARLFNIIGPRQTGRYGMVVPTFVRQAVHNEPLTVFGDGQQTRSFCDVRDAVIALDQLAACRAATGEVINVGNAQEISIKELAELVKSRAGSGSPLQFVAYRDAYNQEFEDISHRRPVLTKLNQLTGFQPQWSLSATIDDLIARERAQERIVAVPPPAAKRSERANRMVTR